MIKRLFCKHNYLLNSRICNSRRKGDDNYFLESAIYQCINCGKLMSLTETVKLEKGFYKEGEGK